MTELKVLARRGQLEKFLAAEIKAVKRAPGVTVRREIRKLQLAARSEVNAKIGGKRKVGGAIRNKVYDNPDGSATGLVFSKLGRREGGVFIDYLAIHTTGRELRAKRGKFMVIPVKGVSRRLKAKYRKLEGLGTDPKLALIPQRGGNFLFVRHTRTRSTLLARLVRRARIPKRLDFERLSRDLPDRAAKAPVETLNEQAGD